MGGLKADLIPSCFGEVVTRRLASAPAQRSGDAVLELTQASGITVNDPMPAT